MAVAAIATSAWQTAAPTPHSNAANVIRFAGDLQNSLKPFTLTAKVLSGTNGKESTKSAESVLNVFKFVWGSGGFEVEPEGEGEELEDHVVIFAELRQQALSWSTVAFVLAG